MSFKRTRCSIFDQYLQDTALPVLELTFDTRSDVVHYRWKADEPGFRMPVRVGTKDNWQIIQPTTEWQWLKSGLKKEDFQVATDLYYVEVRKL